MSDGERIFSITVCFTHTSDETEIQVTECSKYYNNEIHITYGPDIHVEHGIKS